MNNWNDLSEQVRRGNNRSQIDQAFSTFVAGAIMLATLVVSFVVLVKTGSVAFAAICFFGGIGAILGFGAAFWRDKS